MSLNKYQKFYQDSVKSAKNLSNELAAHRFRDSFKAQLKKGGVLDRFHPEYYFHPLRKWRFDWAIVPLKIGIELNGGTFSRPVICHQCGAAVLRNTLEGRKVMVREGGRHNSGEGAIKDWNKMNAAAFLGWRVLQFGSADILSGSAFSQVMTLL